MTNLAERPILEFAWSSDAARLALSRGRHLTASSANRLRHPGPRWHGGSTTRNSNKNGVRLWTAFLTQHEVVRSFPTSAMAGQMKDGDDHPISGASRSS